MNKLEAKLNHPEFKTRHFVINKDGSVYCVYLFYIMEEHGKHNASNFDGDLEESLEWTMTRYITNFSEIAAIGPMLYETDRENFLKQATLLVSPYDDPSKVYNQADNHEFKIEFTDPTAESDEFATRSCVIGADRFEVALALWENTTNQDFEYLLNRITELDQGEILNIWQVPGTTAYDRGDLVLVFSA